MASTSEAADFHLTRAYTVGCDTVDGSECRILEAKPAGIIACSARDGGCSRIHASSTRHSARSFGGKVYGFLGSGVLPANRR